VGSPTTAKLPNGDLAWVFNGTNDYVQVADPSDGSLSINKTGAFTVECWWQPDSLNMPKPAPGMSGGVNILGKCKDDGSAQSDEWQYRYYNENSTDSGNTPENCCWYAFNPSGNYGAGYDDHTTKTTSQWIHTLGVYSTSGSGLVAIYQGVYGGSATKELNSTTMVDSVEGKPIVPGHTPTPVTIGACGIGGSPSFLQGKIGKFAIYDKELSAARIAAHFAAMT